MSLLDWNFLPCLIYAKTVTVRLGSVGPEMVGELDLKDLLVRMI